MLAEAHSEEPAQPKPESPCRSDGANPVPYSNRRPVLPPILGRRRLRRIADSGKGRPGRDKGRLRKSRGRCPTTIIDALKADHGRRRIAPFKRRSSKNRMRKNSSTAGKMACRPRCRHFRESRNPVISKPSGFRLCAELFLGPTKRPDPWAAAGMTIFIRSEHFSVAC